MLTQSLPVPRLCYSVEMEKSRHKRGSLPSRDEIISRISYDPETGQFTRLTPHKGPKKSAIAGCVHADGYVHVHLLGRNYLAHRLAWLCMTGETPPRVDHKNRIRSDNRWGNLRLATQAENAINSGAISTNTSGHRGVAFHKGAKKWRAYIVVDGKQKHLGLHETIESAASAYKTAAKRYFGDFAA